jgi:hypothetical protein
MSVNREEIKRLIDQIPDQDASEVLDFIGNLTHKRKKVIAQELNVKEISSDEKLIKQVEQSRMDREAGRVYEQATGLEYLRARLEEFERGQNL